MNKTESTYSEWQTVDHALAYLARADKLPHRTEGERVLLDQISQNARRILDLGTGNGRTLALVKLSRPTAGGVALDFSDPMLEQAKKRFQNDKSVKIVKHDFSFLCNQQRTAIRTKLQTKIHVLFLSDIS